MHKKFFKKREKKIWDLKSLRWDQKSTTFFFFFVYNVNHYATVTHRLNIKIKSYVKLLYKDSYQRINGF